MITLHYLYIFLLTILSSYTISAHSMELRPLNWIEREIFLAGIEHEGIDTIKEKVSKMAPSGKEQTVSEDEYLTVELKLYPTETNNVLVKMIHMAINIKEQKDRYISLKANTEDNLPALKKNNFLGDYTEYWHEEDDKKDDYIRCKSIFTKKEVLEDVLTGIQLALSRPIKKSYKIT